MYETDGMRRPIYGATASCLKVSEAAAPRMSRQP